MRKPVGLSIVVVCLLAGSAFAPAAAARVDDPRTPGSAVTVVGGLNDRRDPTIVVDEFLPSAISVRTGTQVRWRMAGPEPHSVTFEPQGSTTVPRLDTDPSLLLPTPAAAPYDGTTFANSGVVPLGKDGATFSMSFAAPGRYTYFCVVHPDMVGTVTVTRGAGAQSAAAVARAGRTERARYLAEGRAAKRHLLARRPTPVEHADGTTTYLVAMGAATRHTEILAFAPSPAHVRAGDHVTFVNDSAAPHTASFGGSLVPVNPNVDDVLHPVPGPGPQALTTGTYLNTGWLPPETGGAPVADRAFTFDAPTPGTYTYVCVLHLGSGMAGQIDVGG